MSHWLARSPPRDFFDVTLADEESALEFTDVTLAREDDRRRVHRHYHTQTEVASLSFVKFYTNQEINLLKLATVLTNQPSTPFRGPTGLSPARHPVYDLITDY